MASFANELRSLMNQDSSKQYFLTAAPQCPYPDQADKDILNGPVDIDAVWVQFYNNFCGVNNFNSDSSSNKYNFEEWDNWAKTVSQNPNVKVLVGVPADTTAASTGYVPADKLAEVIQYSKKYDSFGGVMMWDATQAEANDGFIQGVRNALGGSDSGSSSSSSNSASTAASAPSSTNSPNTSLSSNAPASSSSSSSSSGSGSSSNGHNKHPTTDAPAPAPTTTFATKPAPNPSPKPQQPEPTAPTSKPTKPAPEPTTVPPTHPSPSETQSPPAPPAPDMDTGSDSSNNDDEPVTGVNNSEEDDSKDKGPIHSLLTGDLFGLLDGLRQANGVVGGLADGVAHGLTKNLRRANRIEYQME